MQVNPAIFREYDIRGLAERDFVGLPLQELARGLASWYRKHQAKRLLLGRDCRVHSPRIMADLTRLLLTYGFDITTIGHCTTPCFYHACHTLDVDGGLMITASHNPAPDNGLKMLLRRDALFGAQIQEILQEIRNSETEPVSLADRPGTMAEIDHSSRYLDDLKERVQLGPRRLKVVVDCGNGSGGPLTQRLLARYSDKVDLIPMYFEPDGTFPAHEADPVKPKNLVELRRRVVAERADLGVAFDGDGDRIGVVDERAEILWGDQLMVLFWREILPQFPGALGLVEVKCSQTLFDEIARLGGKPVFCSTGHSLIKARMKAEGAIFAGEMSGHLFFADEYYGFDDALYAFQRLLRLLSQSDRKLSQMLSDLPRAYATPEVRIPYPDESKFSMVAELARSFAEEYKIVDVDGARVIFPEGWGLFRASNTQAAIVARCEAKSREKLREYCAILNAKYQHLSRAEPISWE